MKLKNLRRNKKMKSFTEKFERIFTAITFAEAGELDTAQKIMNDRPRDQKRDNTTARKTARMSAPGIKR
jgi:hypothetical protein